MAVKTAAQVASKWSQNLQGATEAYRQGVQAVQTAPGQLAAAQAQKALANFQRKINDGSWASRVASVSLSEWKARAADVGAGNLATGAQNGEVKMTRAMTSLLPQIYAAQAEVKSMSNVTKADAKARMNAWFDKASQIRVGK